jgi:hypothetical protein
MGKIWKGREARGSEGCGEIDAHMKNEEQGDVPTTMSRNPSPVMSDITGELRREGSRRWLKTIIADGHGDGMQRHRRVQKNKTV